MIYNDPALQKAAKEVTVNITYYYNGTSYSLYAEYAGVQYKAVGSFPAKAGDTVTFVATGSKNTLTVDGVTLHSDYGAMSYAYTLTGDIDVSMIIGQDWDTGRFNGTVIITTK